MPKLRVGIGWEPRDLWVGAFWRLEWVANVPEGGTVAAWGTRAAHDLRDMGFECPDRRLSVFVCIVPCVPIRFTLRWAVQFVHGRA